LAIQYNAAANARELERDLREKLSGSESSFRSNPKYQKLQEEQRKLGENIAGQGGFLKKQQEAQQSGNVEYFYDNFSTLDSRSQLGLTIQGNRFLYDFNSSGLSAPASPQDGTPALDAFNFNVPVESKPQSEPEGKSVGQSAGGSGSSFSGKKRLSNSANQEFLGREQMNAPVQQRGERQPMQDQPHVQMRGRVFGIDGLAQPGEYGGVAGGQGVGGGGFGSTTLGFSSQEFGRGGIPGMAGPGSGMMPMLQAPSGGEMASGEGESTTSTWEKQQTQMIWQSTRGMSLTFELPTAGTLYTFSKAGGDPRLALEVQPADSWTLGFRVLWFAIWAGLALLAVRLIKTGKFEQLSGEQLSLGTILFGLLVALLIPAIGPAPGLLLATGGGIAWLVCRYQHHIPEPTPKTPE
ncbi:MAG TPA: hypothetical protein VMM56_17285, partial [Planctomycetaceae bacterium]|nr:hypothetical protein [Planctomycetaceae bacterium]